MVRKIITFESKGVVKNFPDEKLNSVLKQVEGQIGELYLNKYVYNGSEWVFENKSYIGNNRFSIDQTDYYRAYNKIF